MDHGHDCWVKVVHDIMYRNGYGDIWVQQAVPSIDLFVLDFKKSLDLL